MDDFVAARVAYRQLTPDFDVWLPAAQIGSPHSVVIEVEEGKRALVRIDGSRVDAVEGPGSVLGVPDGVFMPCPITSSVGVELTGRTLGILLRQIKRLTGRRKEAFVEIQGAAIRVFKVDKNGVAKYVAKETLEVPLLEQSRDFVCVVLKADRLTKVLTAMLEASDYARSIKVQLANIQRPAKACVFTVEGPSYTLSFGLVPVANAYRFVEKE